MERHVAELVAGAGVPVVMILPGKGIAMGGCVQLPRVTVENRVVRVGRDGFPREMGRQHRGQKDHQQPARDTFQRAFSHPAILKRDAEPGQPQFSGASTRSKVPEKPSSPRASAMARPVGRRRWGSSLK